MIRTAVNEAAISGFGVGVISGLSRDAAAPSLSFITTWDTTGASETITLPATSASNSFDVDWGDGSSVETVTTANPSHVYAVASTYEITITGICPTWSFNDGGDKLKIKDVSQWGDIGLTNLSGGFYGCSNMTTSATDSGSFSAVTSMLNMFRLASVANPDVSSWNVGSVTSISGMFQSALLANPDVSSWNVSSVTNMSGVFRGTPSVNPDVSSWDVSSVTTMNSMFLSATVANPDVSSWDVSSVSNTGNMFASSAFSSSNYDLLLAAWSVLSLQSSLNFHAGTAQYTEVTARAVLTDTYLWVITDGGPA